VRSARPASVYLFQHFGAIMMASGGADWTYRKIFDTGTHAVINDFDGGKHFYRWNGREMPHNLYTSQAQMLDVASNPAPEPRAGDVLRSWTWSGTEAAGAVAVPELDTTFAYTDGGYRVISGGSEENDVVFGPVRPKAVAVLHVKQWVTEHADPKGAHLRDFDLMSGGAADFYAGGTVIHGNWSSDGPRSPLVFKDAAGAPLGMPHGLLWVGLAQ
jgi:hypothetical protein